MKRIWSRIKLRKSQDFQRIIRKGRKLNNESFVIFFSRGKKSFEFETLNNCKIGISVPQKILKKSNQRNKFKRQIRSIALEVEKKINFTKKLENWELVVVMRKEFLEINFWENENRFRSLIAFLIKINKKSINEAINSKNGRKDFQNFESRKNKN